MTIGRAPVVMGCDGSPGSIAAEGWALSEARSRNVPLRLVYAYSGVNTYTAMSMYPNGIPMPDPTRVRAAAEKLLGEAAARLAGGGTDVEITTHTYDGNAESVLLDEGTRASAIVLGSRQLGTVAAAVLGSVSTWVSARAACPVVVVRGSGTVTVEGAGVVVGVQADENCEDAIGFAFDLASRRSLRLTAVLCWRPEFLATLLVRPGADVPEGARALLSESLAGWREKYPDVEVEETVVLDHPVDGLVFAAKGEHLLVVGTHGRGAVAAVMLGSVSQGVLHHASCPVAVVPSVTRS